MADQGQPVPAVQLTGTIPLGRGLMPEELAEFKAKGREWSRLYKEKRRKEFSAEQVEERKLKNRLRQKRFRERQKSREQEEAARLAASLHQQQIAETQHHQPQHEYDPGSQMHYDEHSQSQERKLDEEAEAAMVVDQHGHPQETLIEKRKRLGRERQARFREKKRVRSQTGGSGGEVGTPGLTSGSGQHHEILTLTELQKMSAQLSGYYTGLTQGLSQEEHQAVMRFFLDNIREELGDEVFGGPANYTMADVQAHAAAAQAQYLAAGQQGLDLHALQAAAAAHLPQSDLQAHIQAHAAGAMEGHMPPPHLQSHIEHAAHMAAPQAGAHAAGELTQAQLESYHRQMAEHQAQQEGLNAATATQQQEEVIQQPDAAGFFGSFWAAAYQAQGSKAGAVQNESQHIAGNEHGVQQQGMMYGQTGVPQEMSGMHYVHANPQQH